jgi:hypothetical protein
METKQKNLIFFLGGIVLSGLLAWVLSLTGIWQLVLIAGFAAGVLNYSMGRGCLSGGIGVLAGWGGIMLYNILTNNSTVLFATFGGITALLGLPALQAWIFYVIILVSAFLFGILGGALGGGLIRLIVPKKREK